MAFLENTNFNILKTDATKLTLKTLADSMTWDSKYLLGHFSVPGMVDASIRRENGTKTHYH